MAKSTRIWALDPNSGGTKITPARQRETTERLMAHAKKHYAGMYTKLFIRFRGAFCYIDAERKGEKLPPPWSTSDVVVMDADAQALLLAKGFLARSLSHEHPEIRTFSLPGYASFLNTLVVLSALMGLFTRLGEVDAGMRATRARRLRFPLLAKGPPLTLLLVWVLLAWYRRATYAAIFSYLHQAWPLSLFVLAAVASASLCWHAWRTGDIQ